ncbi:hypothetical protein [Paludisphaera rhizosphaerae]|uniref:hypothetical protein n=1 Tax=Paludisphaera rhizosphaerae TaxID=2711216 RepID=UPI0013EC0AE7|nr:hypothetical protein [Paludisphaera rhizosphaerae]
MTTTQRPSPLSAIAAAAMLALASAGCGAGPEPPKDASQQAASQFLEAIQAGKLESAWQETSTEFKSLMGLENLRDYIKTHPALKGPTEFTEVRRIEREGHVMAECRFHGSAKVKGKAIPATIDVIVGSSEGGEWKVEKLSVE